MSLWNKTIAELTYQDVEIFCQQRQTEGLRLDYKREFNEDLRKLICAFANTLGGMIILGVEGDKHNQPIWPPCGLANAVGLEDRIIQMAHEGIYPPVRPHISKPLLDSATGKMLLVVRVDESPEAPHAVEGGTKVYVYERAASTNKPWSLAHIDQIKRLLDRRKRYEDDRELSIKKAVDRGRRYLTDSDRAIRWASIIPLYPWRRLCDPEWCYSFHSGLQNGAVQRFPGGSFSVQDLGRRHTVVNITAHGHIFIMEYASEGGKNAVAERLKVEANDLLVWNLTVRFINSAIFEYAQPFFKDLSVERPGLMQFDIGILNAFGKRMWDGSEGPFRDPQELGQRFPDQEFRAQVVFAIEDLISGNAANDRQLFQEVRHGFDLRNATSSDANSPSR
jgi:hypothetical protein